MRAKMQLVVASGRRSQVMARTCLEGIQRQDHLTRPSPSRAERRSCPAGPSPTHQCDRRLRGRAARQNVRMISVGDYLLFLDELLDDMVRIVTELGDELANQRPDVPDSNAPYAILTHCLGVREYWGGYMVGGRSIQRDRAAEFRAAGPVGELVERTHRARRQLQSDLAHREPD